MNKEREALLKKITTEPDIPRKVAPKNLLRFVNSMQPQTQEMRDYLMAVFSAETRAESDAIHADIYAKFTPQKAKVFDELYCQCLFNHLGIQDTSELLVKDVLASSVPMTI
jgi:hypothetical protein